MKEPVFIVCPLCNDKVAKLVYRYHIESEKTVLEKIRQQNPGWTVNDGICSRCIDYYHTEVIIQQRVLPGIGPHFPVKSADDFVILPTGLRLDADQRFTGKGITICFIDSGFYPHPDLTAHVNRIKKIVDIAGEDQLDKEGEKWAWHGTMTTVVCAGDGYLSNGLYRGIAPGAELVLLKVSDRQGRISTVNMVKALDWVLQHHDEYGIRIINMSVGDDEAISYKQSEVDRRAEELNKRGVIIVAAVGNDEKGTIKPPANSPAVITVGGIDDENRLGAEAGKLYHSAYGLTTDGLMKPELVAQAIWIAAPILPGTKEQAESKALHYLLKQDDEQLIREWPDQLAKTELSIDGIKNAGTLREMIRRRIQECKYIGDHYMHVDGTSFAAPVVCAVIAQLLEANPSLDPATIRDILYGTAKRIENYPAERQGFGRIRPRQALLKVLKREPGERPALSPVIKSNRQTIEFYVQHDNAVQLSLAGSFNQWSPDGWLLEPLKNGWWKIEIPMLPEGIYRYKFFADDREWIEDMHNPSREPDGFNGFNSILVIKK